MTARRRRGLVLLSIALASGGLAASQVRERERRAAGQLGPSVDVLVAANDLRAGARIERRALAIREVPARFAPPDALTASDGVVGARIGAPVPSGAYLTAGLFDGGEGRRPGGALRRGERAVTVQVAAGGAATEPDTRVDVLVSTETGPGGGRTTVALAGAQLLHVGAVPVGADAVEGSVGPTVLATLRVTLREAIYLTAADNFAREIRLLARPPGERSRAGGVVTQGEL